MYPRLMIHLDKYRENLVKMIELCDKNNIALVPVTKVFCAEQPFIDVINQTSIEVIGDSRILNLKSMQTTKKKMLLRLPMLSEVSEVIQYCDMSLNSEWDVLVALNEEAKKQHKTHGFLLMIDLGDLREGLYYQALNDDFIKNLATLDHLHMLGIGTNLTCYGGVIPSKDVYHKLENVLKRCEEVSGQKMMIISGGNSSSVDMLIKGELPSYINQLRIGESIILGRETAYGTMIKGFFDDVMTLEVEIIELKEKPSQPEGDIGMDAFGETHHFEDRGLILRALGAVGRQDVAIAHLIPPKGIHLLGASSDHLVMEIVEGTYHVGDIITFKLTYGGILSLMTSRYVEKCYVR